MGRWGRKRQLEVETEYWQLLKAGVGALGWWRRAGWWASPARPGIGGGRRTAGSHQCAWPRRSAPAGTCRCWSASGSRPCAAAALACARSPDGSAARRPRSAASCAATCARTTSTSTTVTWPTPAPGSAPSESATPDWPRTTSYARSCRPSWSWTGTHRARLPARAAARSRPVEELPRAPARGGLDLHGNSSRPSSRRPDGAIERRRPAVTVRETATCCAPPPRRSPRARRASDLAGARAVWTRPTLDGLTAPRHAWSDLVNVIDP
jgi:hypothetical protein